MVWPWLTQAARAWGSDTQRVPCRLELPVDPVVIVPAIPPVTVGAVAQVVAAQAGAVVPVAAVPAEVAAEEAAVVKPHQIDK